MLGFDDVFIAADQTPWLLTHRPEALEGFDHNLPEFARIKDMPRVRFLPAGRAFLLVELGGASRRRSARRAERVIAQARALRECTGVAYLADAREQAAVWQIRESGLGSSAFIPGRPRSWPGAEDSAVPPANLGEFLRGFDRILSARNLEVATYYGHFGEGCVHARVNFDLMSASGIATFRAAMVELGELVANLGGSLSGEHGDGLARSELLPMMFRPELDRRIPRVQANLRSRFEDEPRRDRRSASARLASESGRELSAARNPHAFQLQRRRRTRRRGAQMRRNRQMPQDRRRHDVPVVHGDARGDPFDARSRENPVRGADH